MEGAEVKVFVQGGEEEKSRSAVSKEPDSCWSRSVLFWETGPHK